LSLIIIIICLFFRPKLFFVWYRIIRHSYWNVGPRRWICVIDPTLQYYRNRRLTFGSFPKTMAVAFTSTLSNIL
jgi:hypothetical protein